MDKNVEEFHKRLNELYHPPTKKFTIIDVPDVSYLVIDGQGNPDSEDFKTAIKGLFSVVHLLKPIAKKLMGKNFVEPPLECLYWADDKEDFIHGRKDKWKWRVMIVGVPAWVSNEDLQDAVTKVEKKLGSVPEKLRFQELNEGKCVQIKHIGDYSEVSNICNKLYNDFLPENNLKPDGYYHEIYLNDPNRTAPEKRKMVLRQPVSS